ncbi:AAA-like domain-containing protein [Crocosphaera sp.]|uniref:AAA-like domain-containing protein n=1 Tax=Crocosphaera sp. TaxID=2729996 RepID=UPI003F235E44|nr:AAA-like domain-containing protein [Crocosphaera sp.]
MNDFYHVGGSVPLDSPSYIKREADDMLYRSLKNGQFCYVLNSRQMGKSSLWVHTQNRLKDEGIQCATINLLDQTDNSSEEAWYRILFYKLVTAFDLSIKTQRQTWWNERSDTSPLFTLTQFIEEILLEEVEQSIVICFDEIDSVLSLNFSSGPFFSFIRSCYEKRNTHQNYYRLTFCILGVATTADFIPNNARSPFNIGKDITLEGFRRGDTLQLAQGLKDQVNEPETVLDSILDWTGGQPFLTQKICQLIHSSRHYFQNQPSRNEIDVYDFIRLKIINNWESNDNPQHLRTIKARLLNNSFKTKKRLLELYREILGQGDIKYDGSRQQIQLRLTGLVVQTDGKLKVYNKIYKNIFDAQWTENELNKIPPYSEAYEAWLNSGREPENLLSDEQLDEAIKWGRDKNLHEQEREFLTFSQLKQEQQKNIARQQQASRESEKRLSPVFKEEQRQLLITEISQWTGNQPKLTDIISSLVVNYKDRLEQGKEKNFIEQLIQEYIIENWQSNEASEHLTQTQEAILEKDGNREERLNIYKDILQVRVLVDNNPEKIALLQSQLVIRKEDYLEVANPIYKEVFNLKWVEKKLEELKNIESNPRTPTIYASIAATGIFLGLGIYFIFSKPTNTNTINPPLPSPTNIPEICVEEMDFLTVEKKLENLQNLQEERGNNFPLQCQEKLEQVQQEKLNQQLYKKAVEEGANDRVKRGVIYLCQTKEIPKDIESARDKLKEWFDDSYWREDVIESIGKIDNCPPTERTAFEQYLKRQNNE